jgi:RNA polymerase sigma-70 factor (ECF subfamily)
MRVKTILDKLPIAQRKAFVLSHYRELNNNELADVLNISVKAAESLLFRARKNLQKELKKIES